MKYYNKRIEDAAYQKGYTNPDIDAAFEFYNRKERKCHPPGEFDNAGRFYADERTQRVESVRSPSRSYPYPEMTAARTAEHCAEVYNATPLHVKRIYDAIKKVNHSPAQEEEILSRMKLSTIVSTEIYQPEKFKGVPVTKPELKEPVVSSKKPFNPLKEVTSIGFKTARRAKRDGSAEVVSAYKVAEGYVVLAPKGKAPLPLANQYFLMFLRDLDDPEDQTIKDLARTLGKDSFMKAVETAIGRYTNTP